MELEKAPFKTQASYGNSHGAEKVSSKGGRFSVQLRTRKQTCVASATPPVSRAAAVYMRCPTPARTLFTASLVCLSKSRVESGILLPSSMLLSLSLMQSEFAWKPTTKFLSYDDDLLSGAQLIDVAFITS